MSTDKRTLVTQVRVSPKEKRDALTRATALGNDVSANARRGMLGSPIEDLAIIRTAIRSTTDHPPGLRADFTVTSTSFATVKHEWPTSDDLDILKKWLPWATEVLRNIAITSTSREK